MHKKGMYFIAPVYLGNAKGINTDAAKITKMVIAINSPVSQPC